MTIDESLRTAHVLKRDEYPYIIHPLMDGVPRVDPALLIAFAEWAATLPAVRAANVILAPEAMGVPLAAAVSMKTGIPYLVIRKRQYHLPGETLAYCETGYGKSCLYINDVKPEDRCVIIDDVISTGGTLDALLGTLTDTGATVTGVVAFVDKGARANALATTHQVPIISMRRIHVEDTTVVIDS